MLKDDPDATELVDGMMTTPDVDDLPPLSPEEEAAFNAAFAAFEQTAQEVLATQAVLRLSGDVTCFFEDVQAEVEMRIAAMVPQDPFNT